jgi:hypothetical protein
MSGGRNRPEMANRRARAALGDQHGINHQQERRRVKRFVVSGGVATQNFVLGCCYKPHTGANEKNVSSGIT